MSLSSFLKMQSLAQAMSQVKQLEQKLADHLEEDKDQTTKEFEEAIAHWKAEVESWRAKVDSAVLAHIDEGRDPHTAFQLAQAGVPTAAAAAAEAAKQAEAPTA